MLNREFVYSAIATMVALFLVWMPLMDLIAWWHAGLITVLTGAGVSVLAKLADDWRRGDNP